MLSIYILQKNISQFKNNSFRKPIYATKLYSVRNRGLTNTERIYIYILDYTLSDNLGLLFH